MHLDAFTHFFPPAYFARMQELVSNKGSIKRWLNLPTLWDLEARRKMVGSFADYQQILTNSMPPVELNLTTKASSLPAETSVPAAPKSTVPSK